MFAMKQLALSPPCYVVYVSNDVPISTSSTFLGYSISQIDFLLMLESRFNDNPCRASFNLAETLLIYLHARVWSQRTEERSQWASGHRAVISRFCFKNIN